MKKLIAAIFFLTVVNFCYSQTKHYIKFDGTIDISNLSNSFDETGIYNLGFGYYMYVDIYTGGRYPCCGNGSFEMAERWAEEKAEKWCNSQDNLFFKRTVQKIRKTVYGGGQNYAMAKVIFKTTDRYGQVKYSRDDAKNRLIELKELQGLDIITQDEYNEQSKEWKKILLE